MPSESSCRVRDPESYAEQGEVGGRMTIRLVDEGWRRELAEAARADVSELRIICPFIRVGALESLLSRQPDNVQVIRGSTSSTSLKASATSPSCESYSTSTLAFAACATFTPSSTLSVQVEQSSPRPTLPMLPSTGITSSASLRRTRRPSRPAGPTSITCGNMPATTPGLTRLMPGTRSSPGTGYGAVAPMRRLA